MDNVMSQRIFSQRKLLNMTMEELGNRVGVSKSTVNKWEKGQIQNIKRPTIQKLANVLDCSPVWLMGIDNKEIPDYVSGTAELIDLFHKANEEQRKAVLNLLRSFVNQE